MNVQNVELGLIRKDIDELRTVLLALKDHELSGYLSLALSPAIGFISEESHKYLLSRNLINDTSKLFTNYKTAVKKSRALLKLFDDTDGGMDGLIELLNLFQNKTTKWMNIGRRGFAGLLFRKLLQPDNGIYFLDEDPIYMSIVGFSAAGKTKQEIATLSEYDFEGFYEQAKSYGIALGEYFVAFDGVMNYYGISAKPENSREMLLNFKITHNDFQAKKLYQRVALEADTERRVAPVLLFILCQVNIAYHLLPRLLPVNSNLLSRLQFLTAYHATRSLSEIKFHTNGELVHMISDKTVLFNIPNIRKVRNTLAHYGIGEGKKFISDESDLLNEVIKGFCGLSKTNLLEISNGQLCEISEWTRRKFSKTQLKNIRSLLGDHT